MVFKKWIENEIRKQWNENLLGSLKNIKVDILQENNIIDWDNERFTMPISTLIATLSASISMRDTLGTATDTTLKDVKSKMDTSAGYAFAEALRSNNVLDYIATSEGKDEHAEEVYDPLKELEQPVRNGFGIAVDVIDGTTLAAKGLKGAYSLSAAALGLKSFPDLQAYAVGGPKEVLDKFDFFNNPEDEVASLVKNLSIYYNKPIEELRVATSSSDKGLQHETLIENMKKMGVQVIVPDPVIVEPPYMLSMAMHTPNAPDCVIGVLGLPEMVINSLLLSTISTDCELYFRIGSNALVNDRNKRILEDVFKIQEDEQSQIDELKLDVNAIYSGKSITTSLDNACFSATALTDDDILSMKGLTKRNNEVLLETIFSGYNGNTVKILTTHIF